MYNVLMLTDKHETLLKGAQLWVYANGVPSLLNVSDQFHQELWAAPLDLRSVFSTVGLTKYTSKVNLINVIGFVVPYLTLITQEAISSEPTRSTSDNACVYMKSQEQARTLAIKWVYVDCRCKKRIALHWKMTSGS